MAKSFLKSVSEKEKYLQSNIEKEGIIDETLKSYIDLFVGLNLDNKSMKKLLGQQLHEAMDKEKSSTDKRIKEYYRRKQDIIAILPKRLELDKLYTDSITPAINFTEQTPEKDILKRLHSLSHGVVLSRTNKHREKQLYEKIQSGEISLEEAVILRALLEVIANGITNVSRETSSSLSMPRYLLRESVRASIGDPFAQAELDSYFNEPNTITPFTDTEENE
jgi:hypothetical protein